MTQTDSSSLSNQTSHTSNAVPSWDSLPVFDPPSLDFSPTPPPIREERQRFGERPDAFIRGFIPAPLSDVRPERRQHNGGYIDLTADPSSPIMPTATWRRRASELDQSDSNAGTPSAKRRRREAPETINIKEKEEKAKVEEIDLSNIDDGNDYSKVLEQQRINAIKAQQGDRDRLLTLSTIQCVVCMENMTDLTTTYCGKYIHPL